MLTKDQIRELATDTVRKEGMHLVSALRTGDTYSGSNLVALLELFAERLEERRSGSCSGSPVKLSRKKFEHHFNMRDNTPDALRPQDSPLGR